MTKNLLLILFLASVFAGKAVSMGRYKSPSTVSNTAFHDGFVAVQDFSRPVTFLTLRIIYKNRSGEIGYPTLFYKKKGKSGRLVVGGALHNVRDNVTLDYGITGVKPNGEVFFVSVGQDLFEISSEFKLIRRIPIDEFQLKSEHLECEFAGFGFCGNEKLWLAIKSIISKRQSGYRSKNFLVEWDFDSSPANAVAGKVEIFTGLTVDEKKQRVFTFGTPPMDIFNFAQSKKEDSFDYGDFVDFDKRYGFLFSNKFARVKRENPLIITQKNIGSKQVVAGKGFTAVWGYDGNVYFFDLRGHLWRCDAEGKNRSLIFTSSSQTIEPGAVLIPPKMSYDRTFLAFNHVQGKQIENMRTDLYLLDIKNKEYIKLVDESIEYNKMAWLITEEKTREEVSKSKVLAEQKDNR